MAHKSEDNRAFICWLLRTMAIERCRNFVVVFQNQLVNFCNSKHRLSRVHGGSKTYLSDVMTIMPIVVPGVFCKSARSLSQQSQTQPCHSVRPIRKSILKQLHPLPCCTHCDGALPVLMVGLCVRSCLQADLVTKSSAPGLILSSHPLQKESEEGRTNGSLHPFFFFFKRESIQFGRVLIVGELQGTALKDGIRRFLFVQRRQKEKVLLLALRLA